MLNSKMTGLGEWPSVGECVVRRIGRFPVQNSLDARLCLWTQPRYEAPGDLWVQYANM